MKRLIVNLLWFLHSLTCIVSQHRGANGTVSTPHSGTMLVGSCLLCGRARIWETKGFFRQGDVVDLHR